MPPNKENAKAKFLNSDMIMCAIHASMHLSLACSSCILDTTNIARQRGENCSSAGSQNCGDKRFPAFILSSELLYLVPSQPHMRIDLASIAKRCEEQAETPASLLSEVAA